MTPSDLRRVEFRKSIYGYNTDDVDDFLERLYRDYSTLYEENRTLREKIASLKEELERYRKLEEDIKSAVLTAQRTSEEMINAAKLKAEAVYESHLSELYVKYKRLQDTYDSLLRQVKLLVRLRDEFISDLQSSVQLFLNNVNRFASKQDKLMEMLEEHLKDELTSHVLPPIPERGLSAFEGEKSTAQKLALPDAPAPKQVRRPRRRKSDTEREKLEEGFVSRSRSVLAAAEAL